MEVSSSSNSASSPKRWDVKSPDGLFSTWRSGTIQSGKIDQEPKNKPGPRQPSLRKITFRRSSRLDEKTPAGAEGIDQGHDAATRLLTDIGEEVLKVASTRVIPEGT